MAAARFVLLIAFFGLLASAPSGSLAAEGRSLMVSVNGLMLPLHRQDSDVSGTLVVDLSIEASSADTVDHVINMLPRVRDALLTRLMLEPAEGLHLTADQLEGAKKRIVQLVRQAVGAGAVANVYFVRIAALPA